MSINQMGPRIRDPEDSSVIWYGYFDGHGHFIGFGPMIRDDLDGDEAVRRVKESRNRCKERMERSSYLGHI